MKTITFILFSCCALMVSAQISVPQQSTAFMSKKTATWCNPCGTWGWDLFEEIYTAKKDNTILVELHDSPSSKLYTVDGAALYSHFDYVGSTPAFYVNGINETEYSSSGGIYTTTTKNNVFASINATNALTPDANAAAEYSISHGNIHVEAKVKFFNSMTGVYNLGVYLYEENVVEYQNGIGNSAVHKVPFRDAITSPMGDLISTGNIAASSEFDFTFDRALENDWNAANIRLFLVIWNKDGNDYHFINANKGTLVFATAIEEEEVSADDMVIYPNPAITGNDVYLQLDAGIGKTTVDIFDVFGRNIRHIEDADTNRSIRLTEGLQLPAGAYFVSVSAGDLKMVKKLIIQ